MPTCAGWSFLCPCAMLCLTMPAPNSTFAYACTKYAGKGALWLVYIINYPKSRNTFDKVLFIAK